MTSVWRTIQRFPRISVIAAALLLFAGARRVVEREVDNALSATDRSQDEVPGCTSENTCQGKWEVMSHE